MLINEYINNLSGGVSQQPYEARYSNQVDEMINFIPTVAQGLRRRNPLSQFAQYSVNTVANPYFHSYDRGDTLEKYIIMLSEDGFAIFDGDGNQKTVTNNATVISTIGTGSLTNAKENFKMVTVGDTTFVLNKQATTAMTGSLTTQNQTNRAFYWIKRSFDESPDATNTDGYTYRVVLNGTTYSANHEDSVVAAQTIASAIGTNGTFTATSKGSIVKITYWGVGDFDFSFGDSWGDQASYGWKNSVSKLENLPSTMAGYTTNDVGTIEITGTDRDSFNNYYLKWDGDVWTEAVKEGIQHIIDPATMPYKLIRNSDGTFTFSTITWENRICGDDESNPLPSFIGNKISNIFFYKNRLGFTSGENVILSEVGGFYNFFSTTAMEILDGDVIDVSIDSDTVANIRNVNSTSGGLTLWSDSGQFILGGGEILSPSTVKATQTSSYDSYSALNPIVLDNEVLFFNKNGNYLEVNVFSPASVQDDRTSASSISAHIPSYIPSTVDSLAYSSSSNIVLLMQSNTNTVYAYKYHVQNQERIMSSWFKLTLPYTYIGLVELQGVVYFARKDASNYIIYDKLELEPIDISSQFLDYGTNTYESNITMSKYNVMSKQQIKAIREPFYPKNIKVESLGKVDLDIINSERGTTKTVNTKHINRRLFIGGNSEKINVGFKTSYDTGCQINSVSIEGLLKQRSRNISNI